MFDTQPRAKTRSAGPSPKTWCAIQTSPLRAYRVSGASTPSGRLAQLLAEALCEGLQLELLARDLAEQLVAIQAMALGPELPKHPARLSVGEPARPAALAEVL